jgi:hypothetical protein
LNERAGSVYPYVKFCTTNPPMEVPEPETTCRVGRMFATESTSPTKLAVELACMGVGAGLFS